MTTAAQLDPKLNPAYSPNLHAFLTKCELKHLPTSVYQVTKTNMAYPVGELFIGYPDDNGLFNGARMNRVLCLGRKAERWAFTGLNGVVEPVPDFWERYLKVGRCAIDQDHSTHYQDERWSRVSDDKRKCLWCGHEQHRVLTPVTTVVESWHDTKPTTTPCWYCDGKGYHEDHQCPACNGGKP